MGTLEMRNPAGGPGLSTRASGVKYHTDNASAEPLLQRLDAAQKAGNGWRARCPACGGRSRKLSVTEAGGKVLVHCFGGCEAADVIAAVGLTWADLYPPRFWPRSPEERREISRAIRQSGWAAALEVLALEAAIVRIAASQVLQDKPLDWNDYCRLVKAEEKIGNAANALLDGARRSA